MKGGEALRVMGPEDFSGSFRHRWQWLLRGQSNFLMRSLKRSEERVFRKSLDVNEDGEIKSEGCA